MNNSIRKHLLLLPIFLFFASIFSISHAQYVITGQISDAGDNTPLIGATVKIKGTSIGTVTDIEGNYSINANIDSDTLEYSYVGYLTKLLAVNGQKSINTLLEPDVSEIKEIVIVGYGTQKKSDLTGAVSVVTAKDIEKANATSMSKALQGRAAGVTVMSTSGQPGADMNIRVRGVGSINNEAQPIVVIDGVIATTNELNGLNPQDIESMSILKDAASSAIYGAQSSNGVILVSTKKGKSGKLKVQFNTQFGLSNIPNQMDIMDADEYIKYYNNAYDIHNSRFKDFSGFQRDMPKAYSDSARDVNGNVNSNWQDLITADKAVSQNYNLSVSGGNDIATYMISGTYLKDEGVLLNTSRKLTTIRVNTSYKLGKRITIGENFSLSENNTRHAESESAWLMSSVSSPIMPVYNEDNEKGYGGPSYNVTGSNDRTNPYAELMLYDKNDNYNKFFGNLFGEIKIIDGLVFRTTLGLNYKNSLITTWKPKYELDQRSNVNASLSENPIYYKKIQWDNTLSYSKTIASHDFSFLAGHSAENGMTNSIVGNGSDYRWEDLRTLTNGNPDMSNSSQEKTPVRVESYFGRVNYNYNGKYLFTGTFRRDGSSKFGSENRWGNFPAFSVGWKLNKDFLQSIETINLLKIRAGWGKSGNLPDDSFLYTTQVSTYDAHVYNLGKNTPIYGVAPFYNYASPTIQWEEAVMSNVGFDLAAFSNRFQFTGEYYVKKYNSLLTYLPLKVMFGLSKDADPPIQNYGDMKNSGFEFSVVFKKYEGDFNYSINANLTTIKNELIYIPIDGDNSHNPNVISYIGQSVGSYYGYITEGILQESDFQVDERGDLVINDDGHYIPLVSTQQDFTGPGDIKFKDLNHDGKITTTDRTIIGKSIPDFTYGFNFDFSYKRFDLNMFFQGVQNVDVYNNFRSSADLAAGDATSKDENKLRSVNNYWTPDNSISDQTGVGLGDFNDNARFSTWWLEDASFLRFRNMQLGYTLPSNIVEKVNISRFRIYVGGENLFVLTKYRGYDPEVSSKSILDGNVDDGRYPVPRTFILGLNLNF